MPPRARFPWRPFVNVTFNQPMVPLATLEALAAEEVPVQLEPALPGTWKWLGTKTLSFEYDSDSHRPPAHGDRVRGDGSRRNRIGHGRRAGRDGPLDLQHAPAHDDRPSSRRPSPQPLDPLFLVAFDQRIDPEAVLDTIQVTADGQAVSVRLATERRAGGRQGGASPGRRAGEGRWLAFVAEEPLPADASISVTVGPGTPSAEGPLVTEEAQRYEFRTYAPLRSRTMAAPGTATSARR